MFAGETLLTGIINEEWRSIDGYMNYQVSNIGRVRNITTGRILKRFYSEEGYLHIYRFNTEGRKVYCVHTPVAQEFIRNHEDEMQVKEPEVTQIDNDKENNCINSLRWVSPSAMHRSKQQRMFVSKDIGVYFDKGAQKWRAEHHWYNATEHIGYFDDETEAARAYNARCYGSDEKNEMLDSLISWKRTLPAPG